MGLIEGLVKKSIIYLAWPKVLQKI